MAIEVDQAIAKMQEMVKCRCNPAYKDRGLHDPNCQCDYASEVQVIVDYIGRLEMTLKGLVEHCEVTRDTAGFWKSHHTHQINPTQWKSWCKQIKYARAIVEMKGQNDD
jgi:hypothetical protein